MRSIWPLLAIGMLLALRSVSSQSSVPRDVVVATQSQEWAGATLSFVIDITGSMFDDLLQVRNGVQNIFKAISEQQDVPVLNYALVTFHDPDIALTSLTADQTTFENAVEDALDVHGGGDCPEMSIGGINLALRRSLPRSFIFVFTDASAKDHHLKGQALSLIQETQSQVIFVLTGDCNDQGGPGFQAYRDIAAASAGQIFFLRRKNEVSEVLKFIQISVNARQVNLFAVETRRTGRSTFLIPVDNSLQQLIVSVSTNTTTGGNVRLLPDIRLRSPANQEFIPAVDLGSVVVINISLPVLGWWNLEVNSPLPYSVRVKGVSLVDFKIHFTVASGTERVFITRPVEGQDSFIVLEPTDDAKSLIVTGMQLIDLRGNILRDIALNWNTSQPYPRLAHPGFRAPLQLFYVRVRGRDSQNMTFYRLTPTPVRPGQPSPPTVIDWVSDINGELGGSVQLRCDYRSLVQATVSWYRNGVPVGANRGDNPRFIRLADGKLLISPLTLADADCYNCRVTSIAGNDTGREICLDVLQPPRITQPPAGTCDRNVIPGSNIVLQCSAAGDPQPTIRWEKDGRPLVATSLVRIFSSGRLLVRQSSTSDSGRYSCVAENGVGLAARVDCDVALMTAPTYTEVRDATAILGTRATLTCNADGSPLPITTWWRGQDRLRNSSRITSLDSGVLIFHSVAVSDEGQYTCVASNPAGRRSSTGFLTVLVPPDIVVGPDPRYVSIVGDQFRLLCIATGKPDPQITWLFNSGPLDLSRFTITANSLQLAALQVSDEGKYTCVATNTAGNDSIMANLVVQEPPRITTREINITVLEGVTAFLPCEVSAKPPAGVTWNKQGGALVRSRSTQLVNGLQIRNTIRSDGGIYTCIASNPAGQVSRTIELIVEIVPTIAGPEDTNLVSFPNLDICLDCVSTALPRPSIVWLRHSFALSAIVSSKYKQYPNGTLCIFETSVADTAEYVCNVTNKHGVAIRRYDVTVLEPPRPAVPPTTRVTTRVNSPTRLPCPVSGNPKPEVRWFFLDTSTLVPLGGRIRMDDDFTLILDPVTAADSRGYQCIATNDVGQTAINVTLNVELAPAIRPFSRDEVIANISQVQLSLPCVADANPPAAITWLKDFVPVSDSDARYVVNSDGTLVVNLVRPSDAGFFTCQATNTIGQATLSLRVIVQVPPTITERPLDQAIVIGLQARFICRATGIPKPRITWLTRGQPVGVTGELLELENIQSSGDYTCRASNNLGVEEAVASLDVLVPPSIANVDVTDIKFKEPTVGDRVILPCPRVGNPPPTVFWMKDNDFISPVSQRYRIFPNGSLLIPDLEGLDRGVYICHVNNSIGDDQIRYDLDVKVYPELACKPNNTVSRVGSSVWLHCCGVGFPVPTITWFKDGEKLQVESAARLRQASNGSLQIVNALASDQGEYTCSASNELGIVTGDGFLTVQEKPQITPPTNFNPTTDQGKSVTLDCPAKGNPPPVREWLLDGVTLPDDPLSYAVLGNGSLVIFDPTGDDSGRYTCRALNQLGEDTISVVLNVNVRPNIETCPANVVVPQGRSARFDCKASGRPTPDIYWTSGDGQFDSRRNSEDPHYVQLYNNNSLLVQAVRPLHSGTYICHAENIVGQDDCGATLTVQEPPVILGPLPPATIDEGGPIILPCISHGLPPPVITWYKNGRPLVADGVRVTILDNGQRLRITQAKGEDTGNYECRAKNSLGEVAETFQLTIQVAPTINLAPRDKTVIQSSTTLMHCTATGRPNPSVRWSRAVASGFFPVLRTAHISLLRNGTLRIVDTQPSHAGVYVCVAANVLGEDRQSARLTVRVLPRIEEPEDITPEVNAGGIVTLPCLAEGNPRPRITWLKDGRLVALSGRIQQSSNGALVISNARPSDIGNYICVASNPVGTVNITVPLTVRVKPTFTQQPQNTTSRLGGPVWLHCVAIGEPRPEVFWLRNNAALEPDSHLRLLRNNTLYIPFVEAHDDALYTCVTRNPLGENRETIHLNVERPPFIEPPSPTTIYASNNTVLICEIKSNPRAQVYWVRDGRILITTGKYNVTTTPSQHILQIANTSPDDAGEYICRAKNKLGETDQVFKLDVITPADILKPENPDVNIAVGRQVVLSCVVSGFPPPKTTWLKDGSPITPSDRVIINPDNSLTLVSLGADDAAKYSCVAANDISSDILVYDLTVLVPPVIIVPPKDDTVSPGETVNFHCVANGVPQPRTSWIHDDVEVTAESAARDGFSLQEDGTLSVLAVSQQHAGRYQCVVTNSQGQARAAAVLTVLSAPVFVTLPRNQESIIGGEAVFQCVAVGLPIPAISWQRNGIVLRPISGLVSIRGGYLQLLSVEPETAGTYTCVATNLVTSVHANATLTVHVPPTISSGPENVVAIEGGDVALHCQAESIPRPVISWLKGDRPVTTPRHVRFPNNTLVIKKAEAADSGLYKCIATNIVGQTSVSASVVVQVPPHIDDPLRTPTVIEGDVAVLPCHVYGDPLPRVTWSNSDSGIESGGRYFMRRDNSLEIQGAQRGDAGVYVCHAENPAGEYSMDVSLDVMQPPSILLGLSEAPPNVAQGGSLTLSCPAEGHPHPFIAWRKDGQAMFFQEDGSSQDDENIRLMNDSSIRITSAGLEHSVAYECIAINEVGRDTHVFPLTVQTKPSINSPDSKIRLQGGQHLQLRCTAQGIPIPSIRWLWNGVPVEDTLLSSRSTQRQSGRLSTLLVTSILQGDAGVFVCQASNVLGFATHNITVDVHGAPIIQDPQEDISLPPGTSGEVTCKAEGHPKPQITMYKDGEPIDLSDIERYEYGADGVLRIHRVDVTDSGIYQCVANNSVDRVSHIFRVFVPVGPEIFSPPVIVQIIAGDMVWLHCNASGNPPPSLSWERKTAFFESVGLTTAGRQHIFDNGTLRIDGVLPGDEGIYHCVASNPSGIDEVSHEVHVIRPPQFLPPLPVTPCLTVLVGETVQFQCRVSGRPTPTVGWKKSPSETDINTGGRFTVDQSGSLRIDNVVSEDGGTYVCAAQNAGGVVRRQHQLCVQAKPVIIRAYMDITVTAGESAVLRCDVGGFPRPRMAWIKNGESMRNSSRIQMTMNAVQSAVMTFSETRVSDGGEYICTATNDAGSAQESGTLTVQVAPSFKIRPSDVDRVEGSNVVLPCAAKGVPKPKITWRRGAFSLPGGSRRFAIVGGSSLAISGIGRQDTGDYVCTASNNAGIISATAKVSVLVAPQIIRGPVDTWVRLGNSLALTCSARGIPRPTLTWLHNGRPIEISADSTDVRILSSGTLHVRKVQRGHSGVYLCRYNNSAGVVIRRARVNVEYGPIIMEGSGDTYAVQGATVMLHCTLDGAPLPALCWKKNGQLVIPEGNTVLLKSGALALLNSAVEDTALYSCMGTNWLGTASKDIQVTVNKLEPGGQRPPAFIIPGEVIGADPDLPMQPGATIYPVPVDRPPIELLCASRVPYPSAAWSHNGVAIPQEDGSQYQVTSNGSLVINSPTNDNRGVYTCSDQDGNGDTIPVNEVYVAILDENGMPLVLPGDDVPPEVATAYNLNIPGPPTDSTRPMDATLGIVTATEAPTVETEAGATAAPTLQVAVQCGQQLNLACGTNSVPAARWLKNGVAVTETNDLEITGRGGLIIPESSVGDSGRFQCYDGRVLISDISVTVLASAPIVLPNHPREVTSLYIAVGATMLLDCQTISCTDTTLQWLHNDNILSPQPEKVQLFTNGSILLQNMQRNERGRYFCRVRNDYGSTDSIGVQLRVAVPPTIDLHPIGQQVDLNKDVNLNCMASGRPRPTISWSKDGAVLDIAGASRLEHAVNGSLIIRRVQSSDVGAYQCNASAGPFFAASREASVSIHPRERNYSPWSDWSACSVSCGVGNRIRRRRCNRPGLEFGNSGCTDPTEEQERCASDPCPVHGGWGGYTIERNCSATCGPRGSVIQIEVRLCNNPTPQHGGRRCLGIPVRQVPCNVPLCPVDGGWTLFSEWSQCSSTCAVGAERRRRTCSNPAPQGGGRPCTGPAQETRVCSSAPCPDQTTGEWLSGQGTINGRIQSGSTASTLSQTIALDFTTRNSAGQTEIRLAIGNVDPVLSRQLSFLQAQLLMPIVFLQSVERSPAFNGRSISRGSAMHRMVMAFDTGNVAEINTTLSRRAGGSVGMEISVSGSVPLQPAFLSVTAFSGDEVQARMSPTEWALISDRAQYRMSNGNRIGLQWSHVLQCLSSSSTPAACQSNNIRQQVFGVSRRIRNTYNRDQRLLTITAQADNTVFPVPRAPCPTGMRVSPDQRYCQDTNSCLSRNCRPPSTCHDAVGWAYCA